MNSEMPLNGNPSGLQITDNNSSPAPAAATAAATAAAAETAAPANASAFDRFFSKKPDMATNIEPDFDNLIDKNLCSPDFKGWINANSNKVINSEIVREFFLSIFALLSEYDSCFERGTFIFQNDTNVLFNILTFNKLQITSSYNCDDPLSRKTKAPIGHPISPDNVHSMGTKTHQRPILRQVDLGSQAGPCVPAVSFFGMSKQSRKNHKFERIFDNALSLNDVCNQCIEKTKDHDHRRVILYYPYVLNSALYYSSDFTNNANKTPDSSKLNFLFVKFETQPASGTLTQQAAHVGNYLKKKKPTVVPTMDPTTRREDDHLTNYKTYVPENNLSQQNKDMRFYRALGLSRHTLEWYNTYVRIGQEFFVSQQLLEYLLMNYLFTRYTCPNDKEGGKRKKTQKRNIKKNKKTKRNNKGKKSRKYKKSRRFY
jgi:hypothetical protein